MTRRNFWIFEFNSGVYIFTPFFLIDFSFYRKDYVSYSWWYGLKIGIWPKLFSIDYGSEFEFKWFLNLVNDRIEYRDIFMELRAIKELN